MAACFCEESMRGLIGNMKHLSGALRSRVGVLVDVDLRGEGKLRSVLVHNLDQLPHDLGGERAVVARLRRRRVRLQPHQPKILTFLATFECTREQSDLQPLCASSSKLFSKIKTFLSTLCNDRTSCH